METVSEWEEEAEVDVRMENAEEENKRTRANFLIYDRLIVIFVPFLINLFVLL